MVADEASTVCDSLGQLEDAVRAGDRDKAMRALQDAWGDMQQVVYRVSRLYGFSVRLREEPWEE